MTSFKVPAYTEISHFRAPYKNSLMGLGAAGAYTGSTATVTPKATGTTPWYGSATSQAAGSKGTSGYSTTAKPAMSAAAAKAEALELYTRLVDDANVFLLGERRELWAARRKEKKITRKDELGAQVKLVLDKKSNWRAYYAARIGAAVSSFESASVAQVVSELLKVISSESLVYTATAKAATMSFATGGAAAVTVTATGKTAAEALAGVEAQLKSKGVAAGAAASAIKTASVKQATLISDATYSSIKTIFEAVYRFYAASAAAAALRQHAKESADKAKKASATSATLTAAAKTGDAGAEAQKETADTAAAQAKKEADEAAAAAKKAEDEKKAAQKAADDAEKAAKDKEKAVADAEEKKDEDGAEVVAPKTAGMTGKVGIVAALALGGVLLYAATAGKKGKAV